MRGAPPSGLASWWSSRHCAQIVDNKDVGQTAGAAGHTERFGGSDPHQIEGESLGGGGALTVHVDEEGTPAALSPEHHKWLVARGKLEEPDRDAPAYHALRGLRLLMSELVPDDIIRRG